ncbi:MAG: MarR family transcriptional regulator [Rhizobiales bacterium]|nr:MarR family transcriptional regulator [Hyphomicrobiales bacterium]
MKSAIKPSERHRQRQQFVQALNRMDGAWVRFLQDKDILDINYSDLYTGLWAVGAPLRKQEALLLMRHLSAQTAKKYLDNAIAKGLLIELPDPSDGRAKLIALSPDLKGRLEDFFDHAIELFRNALQ